MKWTNDFYPARLLFNAAVTGRKPYNNRPFRPLYARGQRSAMPLPAKRPPEARFLPDSYSGREKPKTLVDTEERLKYNLIRSKVINRILQFNE